MNKYALITFRRLLEGKRKENLNKFIESSEKLERVEYSAKCEILQELIDNVNNQLREKEERQCKNVKSRIES